MCVCVRWSEGYRAAGRPCGGLACVCVGSCVRLCAVVCSPGKSGAYHALRNAILVEYSKRSIYSMLCLAALHPGHPQASSALLSECPFLFALASLHRQEREKERTSRHTLRAVSGALELCRPSLQTVSDLQSEEFKVKQMILVNI